MRATAVLTPHARERCVEMGISTKVAKQIADRAEVRYPGTPSAEGPSHIAIWSGIPEYAIVVAGTSDQVDPEEPQVVVTVLFNTTEYYRRAGTTYIPRSAS